MRQFERLVEKEVRPRRHKLEAVPERYAGIGGSMERSSKKNQKTVYDKDIGFWSFTPLIVFLAVYMGSGLLFTALGTLDPFKQIPRNFALLLGVIIALTMGQRKLGDKVNRFAEAAASPGIMVMTLVLLMSGAFSSTAKAMGAVDATAGLGLALIPHQFLVAGLFLISALISTAMGTCMGTVAAIGPIAVGLAESAGIDMAFALSAVLGGSMFGDNLSFISDTTIVATRGAGCAMKDKFRMNFKIALPAAIATMVLYAVMTRSTGEVSTEYTYELIKVIPYLAVLGLAMSGFDIIVVLMCGTILAGAIGIMTGSLTLITFTQAIASGSFGMLETAMIGILVKGIMGLVEDRGGIRCLTSLANAKVRSRKAAQYLMGLIISVIDFFIGNNTVCILICTPVLKPLARKYNISNKRFASILDVFACVVPGLSPIGTAVLLAMSYGGISSPLDVIKTNFYCMLLAVSMLFTIGMNLYRIPEEESGEADFYPELDEEIIRA